VNAVSETLGEIVADLTEQRGGRRNTDPLGRLGPAYRAARFGRLGRGQRVVSAERLEP
jgi:hypothetical protein